MGMGKLFLWLEKKLTGLPERTGVISLLICALLYILSFAQMLLPLSSGAKTVLWAVLFGLAKIFQYAGLTILGAEGISYIRKKLKRKRQ